MNSVPPPSAASASDEVHEPCPTPLAWQQVVRQVAERASDRAIDYNGHCIRARSIGEGPPLYFINGLLGDSELFSLTAWVLREEFSCILFDAPGFVPDSVRSAANAFQAMTDALGHAKFSVYSAGVGCITVFGVLQEFPERLQAAFLQGAFARCRLSLAERLAASVGSRCPGTLASVPGSARILRQNHAPWFPPFDVSRWSFAEQNLLSTPIRDVAQRTRLLGKFDCRSLLPQITVPTMLIRCEGDSPIQVRAQDELEAGLPSAGTEWLHTCGRLPFLTHPHRLKAIVKGFVAENASA